MWCSTASTTTMASSTTMPMARTIPKSVSVLTEKPRRMNAANVPTRDTGTARIGIKVARQLCRKRNTTMSTSASASNEGLHDFREGLLHEDRAVGTIVYADIRREALCELRDRPVDPLGHIQRVGVRRKENAR